MPSNLIREVRMKKLNKAELARRANVNYHTLQKILIGRRNAGSKLALRLEKATGVEAPCWVWPEKYNLKQRIREVMGVEV